MSATHARLDYELDTTPDYVDEYDWPTSSIEAAALTALPNAWTLELDDVGGLYWAPGVIRDRAGTVIWDAATDTIGLFNRLYEQMAAVDPTRLTAILPLRGAAD
ncbi:hypothetical protein [Leifsonia sp. Leaf264]|uniref:hypothetical protein n=1 Tax=Leifsonia sp. Leaf264 TaxID=1736314 RepID=UPI000A5210B9|nr:hypothetical protein [Leifsonia sp. Leaf264]